MKLCGAALIAALALASPFAAAFQAISLHSSTAAQSAHAYSSPTNTATTRCFYANNLNIHVKRSPIQSKLFIATNDARQLRALGPLAAGVNLNEQAPREIQPFEEWSRNCGVGMCDGFALTTTDGGMDYSVTTNQNIPAGSPILYVPSEMVLTSVAAEQEFRAGLGDAERQLAEEGLRERVSLFRLFVK